MSPESPFTVMGTMQSHSNREQLILITQTVLEIGFVNPVFWMGKLKIRETKCLPAWL